MNLFIRAEAERDAALHWAYIAEDDLNAADRFLAKLAASYDFICKQPGVGHQESFRRQKGIRSWRVEGFPRRIASRFCGSSRA